MQINKPMKRIENQFKLYSLRDSRRGTSRLGCFEAPRLRRLQNDENINYVNLRNQKISKIVKFLKFANVASMKIVKFVKVDPHAEVWNSHAGGV